MNPTESETRELREKLIAETKELLEDIKKLQKRYEEARLKGRLL